MIKQDYPKLLKNAIESYDEKWLAYEINKNNRLNSHETRKDKITKIPNNAHEMLAWGEFNRFYIRGLCVYAINNNVNFLTVYRAKSSSNPRSSSQEKIGMKIDPNELLKDLRKNVGIETFLKLPAGPNSELSVKLESQDV